MPLTPESARSLIVETPGSSRLSPHAPPFHPAKPARACSSTIAEGAELKAKEAGTPQLEACPASPATTYSSTAESNGQGCAEQLDDEEALLREVQDLHRKIADETERQCRFAKEAENLRMALQACIKLSSGEPKALWSAIDLAASVGWDQVEWRRSFTALHLAAYEGRDEALPLVLALRADPAAKDWKGRTALDLAKAGNHEKCVEVLQRAAA